MLTEAERVEYKLSLSSSSRKAITSTLMPDKNSSTVRTAFLVNMAVMQQQQQQQHMTLSTNTQATS